MNGVCRRLLGKAVVDRATMPVAVPLGWPTPANRRIAAARRRLDEVCREVIAHRRATMASADDLVGRLVAAASEDGTVTDEEIRDHVLVFLLAGHDTTATALAFALASLAAHPEAAAKVREEADALGEARDAASIRGLEYTTRVLKETMRLYPSVPYIGRNTMADEVLCGRRIAADAQVSVAPFLIHRRADLWPDPLRFDPDRFTPEAEAQRHPFAWFPFGHGPRGCIGQRFAMLEATAALATIVRSIDVRHAVVPELTTDLVLRPVGEVRALVTPRAR